MRFRQVLRKVLEPRLVWSTALYVQPQPLLPGAPLGTPWKIFDARRIDLFGRYPHTYADPFLFVRADGLYIFLEIVQKGGHGEIAAYRTSDLQQIEDLGVVFRTRFHLSFPFVFEDESSIYMVPESGKAGSVSLYEFDQFPFKLRKVRTLLSGPFLDSHLLRHDGIWFLFTTLNEELQLYIADDLLSGDFRPHPASPITADTRFNRSAGSVLELGRRLYRTAQDGSNSYGENVSLIEIQTLTRGTYQERIAVDKVFVMKDAWNSCGSHHLSVCEFLGRTVIATDGKQPDFFINRLTSFWRNLIKPT